MTSSFVSRVFLFRRHLKKTGCVSFIHISSNLNERFRPSALGLRSLKPSKSSEDKNLKHFVDCITVRVKAGNGGDGGVYLSSIFANEFAGPSGGNGGNGGHVIFRASSSVSSLGHIKKTLTAPNGVNGGEEKMDGKNAQDLILDVPIGTLFRNVNREIVAELVKEGSLMIAARGGAGGKGNVFFKSSTHQTPKVAEKGGTGEAFMFEIELRSLAHFGLIGFPNAGKSTILRAVSRARPRVAPYEFTTLQPHVGTILYDDYVQLVVADLPGLIEDAHKNRGLGISFLRHVERCVCLLYVIDVSNRECFSQFKVLRHELEQYQKNLSTRPHAIIANKIDVDGSDEILNDFVSKLRKEISSEVPVIPVSAKMGQNISNLVAFFKTMHEKQTVQTINEEDSSTKFN